MARHASALLLAIVVSCGGQDGIPIDSTDTGTSCAEGLPCTGSNPCLLWRTRCSTGSSVCSQAGNLPNGTPCGGGNACQDGVCAAPTCAPDQVCQPANPCTTGISSCPSALGAPVCVVTGNKPDGTSCGGADVCGRGSCLPPACIQGAACQPSNPCSTGALTCTSPSAPGSCTETGSLPDGAACGPNQVCSSGTCAVAAPPVIVSFGASPDNVAPGRSSTLTWSVTGADTIRIDEGIGDVTGTSSSVAPLVTTAYTLTAANAFGAVQATSTVMVSTISRFVIYCGPDLEDTTVEIGASVRTSVDLEAGSGNPSHDIQWSVDPSSLGNVSPGVASTTTYTAPTTPGTYRVWGKSAWDPSKEDYCLFTVKMPPDSWRARTPMRVPRQYLAAVALNGRIYVMGGDGAGTVEEYEPRSNAWTARAPMPGSPFFTSAAALDGKIYVVRDEVVADVYDPASDSWESLPEPADDGPVGDIYGPAVVATDTAIYAVGGRLMVPQRATFELDLARGRWVPRTPMPTARDRLTVTAVGGVIYAIGGSDDSGRPPEDYYRGATESFDPGTQTWTTHAPMPEDRGGHGAAAVGTRIHVIGGDGLDEPIASSNLVYDTVGGTWSSAARMPTPRTALAAVELDGVIYSIGGHDGDAALRTVEEYTPPW